MTLSPNIRLATEADLPAIAMIHHRNWQIAYAGIMTADEIDVILPEKRLPQWRQWLADPTNMVLVATAPDQAIQGFVYGGKVKPHEILSGSLDDFDCEIYSLHTAETVHGKGLGRALIADAARRWQAMGRKALTLWAYRDNPFRGFYERIGGALIAEGLDDGIPDVAYGWRDLTALTKPSTLQTN
jgi:ribosomal protein S18 acetylase RimI-like enzyme